jgi:hypothetical protein
MAIVPLCVCSLQQAVARGSYQEEAQGKSAWASLDGAVTCYVRVQLWATSALRMPQP